MNKIDFKIYTPFLADRFHPEVYFENIPHPQPASKFIPDYYKKIPVKSNVGDQKNSLTVKKCLPFIDVMTQGYIIPLWCDVQLSFTDDGKVIPIQNKSGEFPVYDDHHYLQFPDHPYEKEVLDKRVQKKAGILNNIFTRLLPKQERKIKKYPYANNVLKFISPWSVETPPGWSCLFTSPFNHLETRFKILDGIIDTDEHRLSINFPFFWTGDTSTNQIIKSGTPIVQVIPFKREPIEHQLRIMDDEDFLNNHAAHLTKWGNTAEDYYRENVWSKRKVKE